MVKIMYNPDHPELIYAATIVILGIQEKHRGEPYCFIPLRANDLDKKLQQITGKITKDLSDIMEEEYEDFFEPEGDNDKYFVLGIYPKTKEEEKKVVAFFEAHEKELCLWVDWHLWSENLAQYLTHQSDKILLDQSLTALQILEKNSYVVFPGALPAEKAMINMDMRNPLTNRYLKILYVGSSLGMNNDMIDSCRYFAFISSVDEMIVNEENIGLTKMVYLYNQMSSETSKFESEFTDDEPLFQKAKEMGRPVGCLFLGDVSHFFFVEAVLEYATKKYPWLCIVGFNYGGNYRLNFASEKLAITEIIENYCPYVNDKDALFKLLNEEVIRAKE